MFLDTHCWCDDCCRVLLLLYVACLTLISALSLYQDLRDLYCFDFDFIHDVSIFCLNVSKCCLLHNDNWPCSCPSLLLIFPLILYLWLFYYITFQTFLSSHVVHRQSSAGSSFLLLYQGPVCQIWLTSVPFPQLTFLSHSRPCLNLTNWLPPTLCQLKQLINLQVLGDLIWLPVSAGLKLWWNFLVTLFLDV